MDTIKQFLIENLLFNSAETVSADLIKATKHWLASLIADNITKVGCKDNKSLSLFINKAELPSSDIEALTATIKGFCVKGIPKKPICVSHIVEPRVNVVNVCINKHFRSWVIANIDVPVAEKKLSKEDTVLRGLAEEHPNIAKPIICKEIGCELMKEANRLSQLIEGTILEHDYDLAELVLPKMKDIASTLLHTDTSEPDFDLKKEKKELKRLRSEYLTEKK